MNVAELESFMSISGTRDVSQAKSAWSNSLFRLRSFKNLLAMEVNTSQSRDSSHSSPTSRDRVMDSTTHAERHLTSQLDLLQAIQLRRHDYIACRMNSRMVQAELKLEQVVFASPQSLHR